MAVAASLTAWGAWAETAPPFAELAKSVDSAPRLLESRATVRAADGRAQQASVRPNPVVSLQVENFGGGRPYGGLGRSETTIVASQALETGGKRAARLAAGESDLNAARALDIQLRADFDYDLALAYAAAEAAEARSALVEAELDNAGQDLAAARALVAAGREAEVREIQARASLEAARSDAEAARAERTAALERLSSLVGRDQPYTGVTPALLARDNWPEPGAAPERAPAVAAAEAARDAAERRVRLEQSRASPDLTLSMGARRLEGDKATALVGGISAPLPLFDKNRGAAAAARAQRDAADARLAAARLDAASEWRAASARRRAAMAANTAALAAQSAAEEAYRLNRTGYEAGRTPLVELLAARRALTESRTRALASRLQRVEAEAVLARLAGKRLGD